MATSNFPQNPAASFPQAVDLAIFSSNQIAKVINGSATEVVTTEGGEIPTVRKALVDNFYFKSPEDWSAGTTETVFNQLRLYSNSSISGWYYAPAATSLNPILMNTTPVGDPNWVMYTLKTVIDDSFFVNKGLFTSGAVISRSGDILTYSTGKSNNWCRYRGTLPHTLTTSSPDTDGGIYSADNPTGLWEVVGDLGAILKTGGTMTGKLTLSGDATQDLEPVSLRQLNKIGAGYIGEKKWHSMRSHLPAGFVAGDGVELNRVSNADLFAEVVAGRVPVCTESLWQSDNTMRGCYTLGNGTTTFRIPDYNGQSAGSLGATFERGDGLLSTGVMGKIQPDAIRNITGSVVLSGAKLVGTGAFTGAFKSFGATNQLSQTVTQTGTVEGFSFSAGDSVPTAPENRVLNVTGCYIIRVAGVASNSGSIDALQLHTDLTALTSRVTTLESGWTWGGTRERGWRKDPQGNIEQWGRDAATNGTPAVITLPIPFPTSFVGINGAPLAVSAGGSAEPNTRFNTTSLSTFTIYSGTAGTFVYMWTARGY